MNHWLKKRFGSTKIHKSKLSDDSIKDKVKAIVDLINSAELDIDKAEIFDKVRSRMETYFDIRKIQVTEHLANLDECIDQMNEPVIIKDTDKLIYLDQLGEPYEKVHPESVEDKH